MAMTPREDWIERMQSLLKAMHFDMDDENFKDTAKRWVDFLVGFHVPYNPLDDLGRTFPAPVKSTYEHALVAQTGIAYMAVCAHHLVPVLGVAHVGYIPKERVVGLSKLARLVYGISHEQPSLQEDVGNKIVDSLWEYLNPVGAICVISAEHGCMACRGVEQRGVFTVTSHLRGVFVENAEARQEFFNMIRLPS